MAVERTRVRVPAEPTAVPPETRDDAAAVAASLQLELVTAAVSVAAGITLVVAGALYGLDSPIGVGPGTFPAFAGALIALGGGSMLVKAARRRATLAAAALDDEQPGIAAEPGEPLPDRSGLIRVGTVVVTTLLAAFFLERLGFVVALSIYMAIVLKVVGHRSWARSGVVGVLVALLIGLAFSKLLGVSLPTSSVPFLEQWGI